MATFSGRTSPLTLGLKQIEQLRPVSFEWKKLEDQGMQGPHFGFIAQDVEKILPSIVSTRNNAERTKGLKFDEIIPLLTKAIQELKTHNDKQSQEIARLRHDFDAYKEAHP
ncbi:MAG: tail fiber domain-containing protein [Alphaproteobacteria bacterium]|nr:tail fiber domain-containing protein [Alphaproteobacteria bacterium]